MSQRITYNIVLIETKFTWTVVYLTSLNNSYIPPRALRCTDTSLLTVLWVSEMYFHLSHLVSWKIYCPTDQKWRQDSKWECMWETCRKQQKRRMVELLAKVCCIGAATVRNLLFDNCKHADLLSTFRSRLKTKLVSHSLPWATAYLSSQSACGSLATYGTMKFWLIDWLIGGLCNCLLLMQCLVIREQSSK